MKKAAGIWMQAMGVGGLLALAALVYYLSVPGAPLGGFDSDDLEGAALAALILFLTLHGNRPLAPKTRLLLGAGVAAGLLLGLVVRFMA